MKKSQIQLKVLIKPCLGNLNHRVSSVRLRGRMGKFKFSTCFFTLNTRYRFCS